MHDMAYARPPQLDPNVLSEPLIPVSSRRTILICDVNPVLACGIQRTLLEDAYLSTFDIAVFKSCDLATMITKKPDILIIDPWQSMDPWESISEILFDLSSVTSLIGYCSDLSLVRARALSSAGFKGVTPQTITCQALVRIVCAVAFGGVYLPEDCAKTPDGVLAPNNTVLPNLTSRETEVLQQVALGISMKEIAAALKVSTKTVETYKTRANLKLNLRSRSDIVQYAIQSGWMH